MANNVHLKILKDVNHEKLFHSIASFYYLSTVMKCVWISFMVRNNNFFMKVKNK